jgi:DNA-directed RNA polymerase specialized sigma24 family protein
VETQALSSSCFRELLETVDPLWWERSEEERTSWVDWYARTARAIARQYANSFRDPCHDASDVLQEIRLKIFLKFGPSDAPHRLLTERPCIRNLMGWKALDLVDWESAERRNARRRVPLPEDGLTLPDPSRLPPDRTEEIRDAERAFRREIRRPEDRQAYLLFRSGRNHREVAKMTGRRVREMKDLRERLSSRLREYLCPAV